MTTETYWVLGWLFAATIGTIATVREQGYRRRIRSLEEDCGYTDIQMRMSIINERLSVIEANYRPMTHVIDEALEWHN